jgi:diguanylate cyclase (GGDEF)-like protein/PAS domain S-box-containing protein
VASNTLFPCLASHTSQLPIVSVLTFGKEFWVNAHLVPFAYGDEPHLLALFEDITERKRAEKSLKLFRTLVDQSNDILQIVDPETMRFLDVNARACLSLGYTREELLRMRVYDIDPTVSEPVRTKVYDELRKSGFAIFRGLHRRKDGSTFPVEVSMRLLHIDRSYIVCVARDISERERVEEVLRNAEEKYRRIFEQAVVGIFQTTPDGRILSANPAMAQLFGYDSPAELMAGLTDVAHQVYVEPDGRELLKGQLEEKGSVHNLEYQAYRKDGSKIWLLENARVIRNSSGAALYYEGTVADITDRKAAEERVQYLAYYDALTGLPNRTLLQDRLAKALASARRRKDKVALLFLDLDRFKDINDSFGHSIGDLLLQEVAERLERCAREQDTVARLNVARLNVDEFLIVLVGVKDISDAAVAAQRFMDTMTAEFAIQDHSLVITCSLGISIFPEYGADGETLIRPADAAMYCAKDRGRNNFQFFTEDMNAQIVERLTLENSLRLAKLDSVKLDRPRFYLGALASKAYCPPKGTLRNIRSTSGMRLKILSGR